MKKMLAFVLFGLILGGALFAEGTRETDTWQRGRAWTAPSQEVSMTGTFSVEDGRMLLLADGKSYSLSAPGYRRFDLDLSEGEKISVSGSLIDCSGDCPYDEAGHIRVSSAVIDGKNLELNAPGMMGRGGRQATGGRGMAPRQGGNQPQRGRFNS